MTKHLTPYEEERARNIAQNRAVLAKLGLDGGIIPKQALPSRKRPTKTRPNTAPSRRSSRIPHLKKISYHESEINSGANDDEEYEISDGEDEFDIPKPKRIKVATTTSGSPSSTRSSDPAQSPESIVTVEAAKTGRSKCRKCYETIQKGVHRIGMRSWIAGRNSMTWQCPTCMVSNLIVAVEATGRCKCKVTNTNFRQGDLKFGLRSHLSTLYLQLSEVPAILAPVFAVIPASEKASSIQVEGLELLEKEDQDAVAQVIDDAIELSNQKQVQPPREKRSTAKVAPKSKTKNVPKAEAVNTQPTRGEKTQTSGKVAWRFGGHVCFGTLISRSETNTHCFARTHKGNTKTLAKGKDYWWIEA